MPLKVIEEPFKTLLNLLYILVQLKFVIAIVKAFLSANITHVFEVNFAAESSHICIYTYVVRRSSLTFNRVFMATKVQSKCYTVINTLPNCYRLPVGCYIARRVCECFCKKYHVTFKAYMYQSVMINNKNEYCYILNVNIEKNE